MGWFWFFVFVAYAVGLRVVARRYFRLRHGLSLERGEQGAMSAALVGLIWPVALFMPDLRDPTLCDHHRHVLERERLYREIEQVRQIRNRER